MAFCDRRCVSCGRLFASSEDTRRHCQACRPPSYHTPPERQPYTAVCEACLVPFTTDRVGDRHPTCPDCLNIANRVLTGRRRDGPRTATEVEALDREIERQKHYARLKPWEASMSQSRVCEDCGSTFEPLWGSPDRWCSTCAYTRQRMTYMRAGVEAPPSASTAATYSGVVADDPLDALAWLINRITTTGSERSTSIKRCHEPVPWEPAEQDGSPRAVPLEDRELDPVPVQVPRERLPVRPYGLNLAASIIAQRIRARSPGAAQVPTPSSLVGGPQPWV